MAGIGRMGRAARKFVLERTGLSGMERVTAEVAVATADVADRAKRDGKPREFLAAAKALGELLESLNRDGHPGEPGNRSGGTAGGRDPGGPADELESLLGAGPTVGHGTHP